jgi:outer membrane protein TolC
MKKIILLILLSSISFFLHAQDGIDRVLTQIEKNSTALQALSRQIEAAKVGAKIGIFPENPGIELGFLNGSPSSLGRRTDFSVKQVFDFPLAYFQKNRLAKERGNQLDWERQKQRQAFLLEARMLCLDLVFANAKQLELNKRLAHSQDIAAAIESKYASGEANILELNRVKLTLLTIQKEVEGNEIERWALLGDLAGLNGGQAIELADSSFAPGTIPEDFQLWYGQAEKNNPQLQWLRSEIERLNTQMQLERSLSMPKLSISYMSESVEGERFRGVTAGISIPLFERMHTVKYAKDSVTAMRSLEADSKLQFFNQMKNLHGRVIALQRSVQDYRARLDDLDNTPLLRKALDKGRISLIEYVLELTMYYQSAEHLLQMERDLSKSLAVLSQYSNNSK